MTALLVLWEADRILVSGVLVLSLMPRLTVEQPKNQNDRETINILLPDPGGGGGVGLFSFSGSDDSSKSAAVRVCMAPPAAVRSSNHSFGGGSFPKKFDISYALYSQVSLRYVFVYYRLYVYAKFL